MGLKDTFQKQGGFELLRRYWQSGALVTAICEFLLLGKSRTALEILRLSTQFKTRRKLERHYSKKLKAFDRDYNENVSHESSDKIWFCWFQGLEKAPELVKRCYQSVKENLPEKDLILLTSENMFQYVMFPDYILDKWQSGQITNTHMTDLLRLELLIKYGGMWVDATVLCTREEDKIPSYFFDSDLFLYQQLKPGRDGHSTYISSWLMSAKTNNKVLMATRYLCYEYWKKNNRMMDYFLLHDFLSIVLEYYPEDWKKIVPVDNSTPHILLLRLFDMYDEDLWQCVKNQTPFHKLSYKFSEEQMTREETFYDKIIRHSK